ncbi:MAG: hypothetical protein AAGK38_07515 [Pseudomonadota bacterium]
MSRRLRDYSRLMKAADPVAALPKIVSSTDDMLTVAPNEKARMQVLSLMGLAHHRTGNNEEALCCFTRAFQMGGNVEALKNALVSGSALKSTAAGKAMAGLLAAAASRLNAMDDSNDRADLADALCHAHGHRGDLKQARQFGSFALAMKHRQAMAQKNTLLRLGKIHTRPFNFNQPKKNVIAFALFGDGRHYTDMAVENMRALRHVYPGWSARFYVDKTVPMPVIEELARRGADIRIRKDVNDWRTMSGMFWRFAVAADPTVDFFLIRDCDALINVREKVAVDEWVANGKGFHIIRDFFTHSELVLGGLWGGRGGALPNMEEAGAAFLKNADHGVGRGNYDQVFLRHHIWPLIAPHALTHDSQFQSPLGRARPFPSVGTMHPARHVGQDMNIFKRR